MDFNFLRCPVIMADGYKFSHRDMYPTDTVFMQSNFTPRNSKHRKWKLTYKGVDGVIAMGIRKYAYEFHKAFHDNFFSVNFNEISDRFTKLNKGYLGKEPDLSGWESLHKLGYLPIEIYALPEGSFVPYGVPMIKVRNTENGFAWLVNYFETLMSCEIWQMTTNATTAAVYAKIGNKYSELSSDSKFHRKIQFHDFSMRGQTSYESAVNSGISHLTSFYGTDTPASIVAIDEVYSVGEDEIIGLSVPATEHSVMTINILKNSTDKLIGEIETVKRLLEQYPDGVISMVADSYDYWQFLTVILNNEEIKETILKRDGKLVIRPDSGNPFRIICGYSIKKVSWDHVLERVKNIYNCMKIQELSNEEILDCFFYSELDYDDNFHYYDIDGTFYKARFNYDIESAEYSIVENFAEMLGTIRYLDSTYGSEENSKGFKVLNEKLGVIYGDSITPDLADKILNFLTTIGYSSDNIVFGIGSYSYQGVTRDTDGTCCKVTWSAHGDYDGISYDDYLEEIKVFKDPKTDSGKKSLKGLFVIKKNKDGIFYVIDDLDQKQCNSFSCEMEIIYSGYLRDKRAFSEIRNKIEEITKI